KIADTDELRKNCRAQKVSYIVSKRTLLKRALKNVGIEVSDEAFKGGVALIAGMEDEAAPAQITAQFAKKRDVMKFLGGILEGKAIDVSMVMALSALPSKKELLARLVGALNAPVSGFVNVLAGNLRGLVNVLDNIQKSKS
ncbi:50S ribosomal protein L10, partial [Candidatus Falkowbacteria bacterium]|nr:50S ribosomal protein L10 [Candidatus Falkowbacteria bacterium]